MTDHLVDCGLAFGFRFRSSDFILVFVTLPTRLSWRAGLDSLDSVETSRNKQELALLESGPRNPL